MNHVWWGCALTNWFSFRGNSDSKQQIPNLDLEWLSEYHHLQGKMVFYFTAQLIRSLSTGLPCKHHNPICPLTRLRFTVRSSCLSPNLLTCSVVPSEAEPQPIHLPHFQHVSPSELYRVPLFLNSQGVLFQILEGPLLWPFSTKQFLNGHDKEFQAYHHVYSLFVGLRRRQFEAAIYLHRRCSSSSLLWSRLSRHSSPIPNILFPFHILFTSDQSSTMCSSILGRLWKSRYEASLKLKVDTELFSQFSLLHFQKFDANVSGTLDESELIPSRHKVSHPSYSQPCQYHLTSPKKRLRVPYQYTWIPSPRLSLVSWLSPRGNEPSLLPNPTFLFPT